jgi:hypothetical protein
MGLIKGIGLFVSYNPILTISFAVIVAGAFALHSYLKSA